MNIVAANGTISDSSSVSSPSVPNVTNGIAPASVNTQPNLTNQSNQYSSTQAFNQLTIPQHCLMMTAKVLLKGPGGRQAMARALLDSGLTMSLISNKSTQSLQLPKQAMTIMLISRVLIYPPWPQ